MYFQTIWNCFDLFKNYLDEKSGEVFEAHSMDLFLGLFDGSSVDEKIASVIAEKAAKCQGVMVILNSNYTHEHVLGELNHMRRWFRLEVIVSHLTQ